MRFLVSFGECIDAFLLSSLSGSLFSTVIAPERVLFVSQIELKCYYAKRRLLCDIYTRRPWAISPAAVFESSDVGRKCQSLWPSPQDEQVTKRMTRHRWIYMFFIFLKAWDMRVTLILTDDRTLLSTRQSYMRQNPAFLVRKALEVTGGMHQTELLSKHTADLLSRIMYQTDWV